jgi:hypothetical protein
MGASRTDILFDIKRVIDAVVPADGQRQLHQALCTFVTDGLGVAPGFYPDNGKDEFRVQSMAARGGTDDITIIDVRRLFFCLITVHSLRRGKSPTLGERSNGTHDQAQDEEKKNVQRQVPEPVRPIVHFDPVGIHLNAFPGGSYVKRQAHYMPEKKRHHEIKAKTDVYGLQ